MDSDVLAVQGNHKSDIQKELYNACYDGDTDDSSTHHDTYEISNDETDDSSNDDGNSIANFSQTCIHRQQ